MGFARPAFVVLWFSPLSLAACSGETILGETDATPEDDADTAVEEEVGADADADADADGNEDAEDTPDTPVGVCPGVAPHLSPDCETCRGTRCCWQAQACAADPDCLAWLTCEDACEPTDVVCQDRCWTTHRADVMKSEYMACRQRECSGICSAEECSADYGYFDARDDECRACRNLHCCNEMTTCWHDVECVDALECFTSCPDTECMLRECNDTEHFGYSIRLAPDWACRNRYCNAECDEEGDCSVVMGYTATCADCVRENCCAEISAWNNDAEAIVFAYCLSSCGMIASCRTNCFARYWRGGGLCWVQDNCIRGSCAAECGMGPATCGDLPYGDYTCTACMHSHCCAEAEACGTSVECAGVFLCLAGCAGDIACHDNCRRLGRPEGVALYDVEATCRVEHCVTQCESAAVP
ncbi:MAG: hypothetical protein JXB32_20940 [Deltaproteobacteria bacterium]|nr:hypothetical protein [Deltaproteobacteria bacterium]